MNLFLRVVKSHIAILLLALMTAAAVPAWGLDLDSYAQSSRLASGKWVKISVDATGVYLIPTAALQQWGFSDPSKVRVYGYGGEPVSDILDASTYVDDLPLAPMEVIDRGVVFYGRGPLKWERAAASKWSHSPNYYSTLGYYFVSDTDEPLAPPALGTPGVGEGAATTFTELLCHESELVSAGSTGHTFLGEDFTYTRERKFNFNLPGRADSSLWLDCAFATRTMGGDSRVALSLDGTPLPAASTSTIEASGTDSHRHYISRETHYETSTSSASTSAEVEVKFSTSASTVRLARLDYINVYYNRSLRLADGCLTFRLAKSAATLSGASSATRVWDVTAHGAFSRVNASLSGESLSWTAPDASLRTYAAWTPDAKFLTPAYVGAVENQDIHADPTPDMVIITASEWLDHAREIAELHRNSPDNPLNVNVYTQEQLFNEFSSGTPEVNAFRRMLKMFWDRGGGSAGSDSSLRYALLLGRGIYDHRAISAEVKGLNRPILLQWQSVDGSHDNTSFTTEDYFAFLLDGSGANPGNDRHCIAVGRIPVTSRAEAQVAVEKLRAYIDDPGMSDWKNQVVLACDDQDNGDHLKQMEKVYNRMIGIPAGRQRLYTKVYVDAFPLLNNVAQGAHDRMFRRLNQGAMWWWYIGHANTFTWTSEGLLTLQDLESVNFSHQPILYAATCDFLRWDLAEESGAEVMFFNPNGLIAAIAATRPVFISLNENMSLAMASAICGEEPDGSPLTLGRMLQNAKNSLSGRTNDTNKLRYVLLGDPALVPAIPRHSVVLDAINDVPVDPEAQPTLKAREEVTMSGRVLDPEGNLAADFDGVLVPTLYDAEYSTTSLAHGEGEEITFEEQGDRLYVGRESVKAGGFRFKISMPSEISHNFRPAALNLYAFTGDGRDASGVNRDIYVYGYAENALADMEPPVIEMFALNHPGFVSGQSVNESPTVIARVSDNVGINISNAGIGHQMSLLLDGATPFADIAQFYVPGDDGPLWGTINYPLSGLSEGDHSLRLRVWDTSNNYAESTIDFNVVKGTLPGIINLWADANPATTSVNFYVEHNMTSSRADVTVAVYDLMGRLVWSDTRSELSASPFTWNLTDKAGRRVNRGIYIYRASLDSEGSTSVSSARKIAVAAP